MDDIIIWGTGSGAKKIVGNIDFEKIKIIGFVDSNNNELEKKVFKKYKKINLVNLKKIQFDFIVVASEYTNEIYSKLRMLSIADEKIVFIYGNNPIENKWERENEEKIQKIFKKNRLEYSKIALVTNSNSGCNSRALFERTPNFIKEKYKIKLIEEKELHTVEEYGTIISTHLNGIYDGRINVDLWHGFGVKPIGVFSKQTKYLEGRVKNRLVNKVDLFITYSKLSQLSMVGMFGGDPSKFKIVGEPRTDFLFSERKIKELVKIEEDRKIILYMPTFRDGDRKKKVGIEEISKLKEILEEKNAILIIKDHMYSKDTYEWTDNKLIYNLSKYVFEYDFYEYLNDVDCLVTDYSSVYFDFLLLDKQMIFLIPDKKEYEEERGLLFEPYEFWAPGYKANTWLEVGEKFEEEKEEEKYKRKILCDLVHKFKDENACNRVWNEIDTLIEKRKSSIK